MKLLVLGVFIGALMLSPLIMLDMVVMPEIISLQQFYAGADSTAANIALEQ